MTTGANDVDVVRPEVTAETSREIAPEPSSWRRFAGDFAESWTAIFGLVLCVVIVLAAIFAPFITPQNPYDLATLDLMDSRLKPGEVGISGMTHQVSMAPPVSR